MHIGIVERYMAFVYVRNKCINGKTNLDSVIFSVAVY